MRHFLLIFLILIVATSQSQICPGKGCILLKFNGYSSDTTIWGKYCYSTSYLNDSNKSEVQMQVGYHFRKFDVVVTQDDSVFQTFPKDHRVKVIVTADPLFLGPDALGFITEAAGLGTPNALYIGDETPVAVSASAVNYNLRYLAVAIAHEVGHTLGLSHQSLWIGDFRVMPYNIGNIYEAPIMGVPYSSKGADWTIGRNYYGKIQDDEKIIGQIFRRLTNSELDFQALTNYSTP